MAIRRAVAELGRDHRVVADIIIDVTGDEIGFGRADVDRIGQPGDLKLLPAGVGRFLQDIQRFMSRHRPGVVGVDVVAQLDQHLPRPHEARERVDMIIGDVLARDARGPDHLLAAKRLQQLFADLVLVHAVAVRVRPAACVGEQRACAVMLDAALLADQTGFDQRQAQPLGHAFGDARIVVVRLLVPPAVEADMRDGELAGGVAHEGRTRIAAPQVVGRNIPKLDVARQPGPGGCGIVARDQHGDGFIACNAVGDPRDGALDAPKRGPVVNIQIDRPLHDRALVRLGFERHFVARSGANHRVAYSFAPPYQGRKHHACAGVQKVSAIHSAPPRCARRAVLVQLRRVLKSS